MSRRTIKPGAAVDVAVTVTNAGRVAGDDVVQLYVAKPSDPANPTLAGFARTHLKVGESRRITLSLDARGLSQVDAQGRRAVIPGEYKIFVGGGQPDYARGQVLTLGVRGPEQALPQ